MRVKYVTQWFDASRDSPKRKGIYEFNYCDDPERLYIFEAEWTGAKWLVRDRLCPDANGFEICVKAEDHWRGVAK